jgi:hypothetical protein
LAWFQSEAQLPQSLLQITPGRHCWRETSAFGPETQTSLKASVVYWIVLKGMLKLGMVLHTCNPST